MLLDLREIVTVGMVLFAVIDIIGSIPIIIDLRTKFGHLESGKASITSGVIM
ncbi:MAG: MarC family protein, partial [Flavobacterium sp.]|nr:MarC family protein [Flavobacterium sp.]